MNEDVSRAIHAFNQGGTVIFPTDTAYGIGCRIDALNAIEKIYTIRERPKEKALLILVASVKMAKDYLEPLNSNVEKMMQDFWPGGLTIVYPCIKEKVPAIVRAGGNTVAVRLPLHADMQKIIQSVGVPIVAPSANISGEKTPVRLAEVNKHLQQQVDFVLVGTCTLEKQSTIIDCSTEPWHLIREGAVRLTL